MHGAHTVPDTKIGKIRYSKMQESTYSTPRKIENLRYSTVREISRKCYTAQAKRRNSFRENTVFLARIPAYCSTMQKNSGTVRIHGNLRYTNAKNREYTVQLNVYVHKNAKHDTQHKQSDGKIKKIQYFRAIRPTVML